MTDESTELARITGKALYVGVHGGAAFGYRYLFVGPELTLVQLFGDAEIVRLIQK